jgi:(R,R)-butanediol dehydrogenase/meso-butanediol dehydrogenase/diacetyl reductase
MGGYGVFDEAIGMMAEGRFNGNLLITKKIPLDDIIGEGFHTLIEHKQDNVKILVTNE